MVAPGPGLRVLEGQLAGVRIRHEDGFEESLRVPVDGKDRVPVPPSQQPLKRLGLPLHPVDRLGLLPFLVD